MKKINILYILFSLTLIVVTGCEDDETDNLSFVTSYPTFTIEGDAIMSIVGGEGFTDPGATATEDGNDLPVTTSGTVDSDTPGLYTLTYSATNSDGYSGSVTRTVVVTAEDVSGTDLSGDYKRNNVSTNPTNTVTKLANGYYAASNGSGDGNNLALVFIHTGGTNLLLPVQPSRFGRVNGTGTITGVGFNYGIAFLDPPNAGLVLNRSFTKQ